MVTTRTEGSPKTVLITGGAGLLGCALLAHCPSGVEVHVTQRRTIAKWDLAHTVELAEEVEVDHLVAKLQPSMIIHTAYGKKDGIHDIVVATKNVTEAAKSYGCSLVHISTDLIFDGEHASYSEDAPPSPIHEYGRWKTKAEEIVTTLAINLTIIRPSLIVSTTPLDVNSKWIADALRRENSVRLFADELRCPIGVEDLALQIWEIVQLPQAMRRGVWHLAGPEALSRYALGLIIAAHQDLNPRLIIPTLSPVHGERRPRDVRLNTARSQAYLKRRARPVSVLFGLRSMV